MKQTVPLTITTAQLVTPEGITQGALRCGDGVILGVGADVTAAEGDTVVDARGKLLAPGWSILACSRSTSLPSISAGSPAPR